MSSPVPWRLLLAALAACYLAYLLAGAGQSALPGLLLGSRPEAEIDSVRVSPVGVRVFWSGGAGRSMALIRGWEVLGGILALMAARFGGPLLRLIFLQTAAWWFLLQLSTAALRFRFDRRWQALPERALPALAGLLLALWFLSRFAQPYVPLTRARRLVAVGTSFSVPAVVAMLALGRWSRWPVSGALLVLLALGALSLLAAALARHAQEQHDWSASATWRSVAAAMLVAMGLAVYPYAQRAAQNLALLRWNTPHYEILYHNPEFPADGLQRMAAEREQALAAAAERLGVSAEGLRLRVFLYSSYEAKRERTGTTAPWTTEAGEIHAVVNEQQPSPEPVADTTALVLARWGEPEVAFLRDAAAVFAAGAWRGRAPRDWGAQITAEEGVYTLAQLTDEQTFLSPLVRFPLAGEFAAWVGRERLRALYTAAPGGADWRVPLEDGWRNHLRDLAATWQAPPARPLPLYFHRGVALSHDLGMRSGYFSRRAANVLESFPAMGVNAVSLQPFGFLRQPDQPGLGRFTDESDEALDYAAYVAQRAGVQVALKPQIWLRGGRWSGEIAFHSAADWDAWWAQYRQWILHYARLAELNGAALFVVGTELGSTTGPEQSQEKAWRRIIADVRRVYRGPITYAAHWGREFETVPFWDALDYIGLNFYYPLAGDADGDAPSAEAAERVATTIEQVQRRWNKPVLFTEVGFPSASSAAREPWRENPADSSDAAQQALCYELVFRTFYGRPWLAGLYWWKWHSGGRGGGEFDRSYTPMNKPAASVMAQWYREPHHGR